jgi:hypothetical protein
MINMQKSQMNSKKFEPSPHLFLVYIQEIRNPCCLCSIFLQGISLGNRSNPQNVFWRILYMALFKRWWNYKHLGKVWERGCPAFPKNLIFFFLLKFNMICMFWIVLMCWCQKWFLKNEKTSLICILARKII